MTSLNADIQHSVLCLPASYQHGIFTHILFGGSSPSRDRGQGAKFTFARLPGATKTWPGQMLLVAGLPGGQEIINLLQRIREDIQKYADID